jgi:endonuclease/exonuclease/phosphatase family metal-dependent hydrolase
MRAVLAELTDLPHALFAPAIKRGDAQFGIALLSRYPIRHVDRRPLPRKNDEPRTLLVGEIHAPGGDLLLLTSHISVVPVDRPDQFSAVTQRVLLRWARRRLPTVVAGDLNAPIDEVALRKCMGWLNLRSALHSTLDDVPPTFPTTDPTICIDHVLVSRDVEVDAAGVAELDGSDHLPVWADLRVVD